MPCALRRGTGASTSAGAAAKAAATRNCDPGARSGTGRPARQALRPEASAPAARPSVPGVARGAGHGGDGQDRDQRGAARCGCAPQPRRGAGGGACCECGPCSSQTASNVSCLRPGIRSVSRGDDAGRFSGHERPIAANARAMPRSPRAGRSRLRRNWTWSEPASHNRVALGKKLPSVVNRPCMGFTLGTSNNRSGARPPRPHLVRQWDSLSERRTMRDKKSVNKVVELGPATLQDGPKPPSDRARVRPRSPCFAATGDRDRGRGRVARCRDTRPPARDADTRIEMTEHPKADFGFESVPEADKARGVFDTVARITTS